MLPAAGRPAPVDPPAGHAPVSDALTGGDPRNSQSISTVSRTSVVSDTDTCLEHPLQRPPIIHADRSPAARSRVIIALAAIAILAVLWFNFVGVFVEYLWFGEVGHRQVFATQLLSRLVLFLIAAHRRRRSGVRRDRAGVPVAAGLRADRGRRSAGAVPAGDLHPAEADHHRPVGADRRDLRAVRPVAVDDGAAVPERHRLRHHRRPVRQRRRLLRVQAADVRADPELAVPADRHPVRRRAGRPVPVRRHPGVRARAAGSPRPRACSCRCWSACSCWSRRCSTGSTGTSCCSATAARCSPERPTPTSTRCCRRS